MNGKVKYLLIIFLITSSAYPQPEDKNNGNRLPKVNRVIPLSGSHQENVPGIFYYQDFETISGLKKEFHDTGQYPDSVMNISEDDANSGKKAIKNTYYPKILFKEGEDPGSSGWVWRFFGDNKIKTHIPIKDTTALTRVFARWYHKFEEGFTSQEGRGTLPPKMARMRCFTTPWNSVYTVLFWIEGKEGYISIQQHTRAPGVEREWLPNYNTVFYLNDYGNLGRWIHMELGVTLGEGRHSDRIQAWADGQLICDIARQDLSGGYRNSTLNGMSWDCYWNNGSPRKQSRFYDDLVLSVNPVGPARTGVNPLIEIAPLPDRGSGHEKEYRVEVAQTTQLPLPVSDPARKQPVMEYKTVWQGKTNNNLVKVDSKNGLFVNQQNGFDHLEYNTLYSVRLSMKTGNNGWTEWSPWHAAFATQWEPGTIPEKRGLAEGYLSGHAFDTGNKW